MKRIFSLVVALMAMQFAVYATVETFKVTTTSLTGAGSLTTALESAKASEADTAKIVFEFTTQGEKVIQLESAVTSLTNKVLIVDASTSKNPVVLDGGDKSFNGFQISNATTLKGLTLSNFDNAAYVTNGTKINFYDCDFVNNNIGIYTKGYINDVVNCVFGKNKTGFWVESQVTNVKNCVFGLSREQDAAASNDYGVRLEIRGNITNFTDNVLATNGVGLQLALQTFITNPIVSCIFGVNKDLMPIKDNTQNTGIYTVATNLQLRLEKCVFSYNYDALYMFDETNDTPGSGGLTVTDCSFLTNANAISVNTSTSPLKKMTIKGSSFGYSYNSNLYVGACEEIELENNNFGGDGTHYYPMGDRVEYSVEIAKYNSDNFLYYLTVKDNVFYSNRGLYLGDVTPLYKSLLSNNLFFNTDLAYQLSYNLPTPVISSAEVSGDDIVIKGYVDTAAVATIELFFTDQAEQTATEFVSSFSTLEDGTFSAKVPNKYVGKRNVSFCATATYDEKKTSRLSAAKQLSIPDIDLTRPRYYVKIDGSGDGSSWEKAMSPQTFAYALPRVGDDVTFYVAEGTYYPIYDMYNRLAQYNEASFVVNSDVSIKGGYPANAQTGAVSDPSKYKTIFSGDFLEDNGINDDRSNLMYLEDDCSRLFLVKPSVKSLNTTSFTYTLDESDTQNYFNMDGVVLKGGATSIYGVGLDLRVTLTNSLIEKSGYIYMYVPNNSLTIDNCKFHQVYRGIVIETGKPKEVNIYNTTFDDCFENFKISNSENFDFSGHIHFESDTFVHNDKLTVEVLGISLEMNKCKVSENNALYFHFIHDTVDVKNCSFDNNNSSYMFLDLQACVSSFEKCSFVKNSASWIINNSSPDRNFRVRYSVFDSNTTQSSLIDGAGNESYSNSSFINNDVASGNYLINYGSGRAEFYNNTFAGNIVPRIIQGDNRKLYNNTIVGNKVSSAILSSHNIDEYTDMYGNIILGNGTSNASGIGYDNLPLVFSEKKNIQYNLMPIIRTDYQSEGEDNTTWAPDNNTNIFVRPFSLGANESTQCKACSYAYGEYEEAVLKSIFEGTYNSTTHVFSPNLDRSGFLPVIALKEDVLSDGTSIRFPLAKTIVTADQRDMKRFDPTCMGAYEIVCTPDTTLANDTIITGEKFLDKVYTTIGRHDSIFETIPGEYGCDNVVMHMLVVKPNPGVKEYYVKTKREGTGDGSSWENAMDGKDFALYLPLAPKGATFYVAEGTYNPVYGMDLTESKSPMYTINNDVTIRGGYPANAETGAASEPDKYKTIFDGDLLGDDEYDEQLDADGYPVINKLNTTENTSTLFFSVAQGRLKARFDGVVLKNVNTAIQLINPDKKLEVLNCSFDHNVTPVSLTSEKDSIYVYNSSFAKNTGNILYLPAIQDIVLDSVLFEGNASNISSSKSNFIYASFNEKNEGKEHLSMNRVRAIGNKANFNVYGYETKVENSLFEANMATDLFRVLNNNKTFEIKKSKFIQNIGKNGGIINSDEKIIIDSCLFEKNDASNWDLIGQSSTNNGSYIQHSEFLGNKATDLIKSDAKGDIVISNCNMAENQVGEYLFNIRSSESTPLYKENSICNNTAADILRTAGGTHLLENNTIASNKVTRYILEASGGNLQLNNNTIVGNNAELRLTYLLGLGLKMTGNIILGNSPEAIYLNRCNIKDSEFKYNIAPSIEFIDDLGHCESISDISSNNIFSVFSEEVTCDEFAEIPNRNEEILTTLFSGTYNSTTGLFSPEVKNNGGPTPTVALMKDILPDGTSIRFPLTETTVSTDQRGVNRLKQTCMGAYEITCVNDTTHKNDTILIGGSFLNKAYTTVGVYDSIFETLTGEDGCDKVIMHKLVVKPDQKVLNYYVKTEREGTGDGSSWENAMNGTDFANYLPLVPNGATFYVAEGRYTPIYNMEENPSHILGDIKEYVINSSLSIIGGYPATAETGATSDPQTYHTIFTGDPSGDDVYKEGYYNSAILLDPNEDDVQVLYLFNASPSSEVYFFGCNFSGASYETTFAENKERTGATIRCDKLKLEKCDFSTFGTIQNSGSSQSTLYASECIFHNRPSISTPSSIFLYDTIHVEKSLFEDMIGTTGGVFGRVSKLADIKNSTFNNIGSSATIMERAEHIRLYNNTFVGLTADGSSNLLFSSSRANKMEIVGNIFKGCKYINLVDDTSDPVHVIKNNLLENINGTDADIMVSDLKDIPLEGTYDGTDAFTPAVKNNGGFTPTIALMKDKLSDGTSIRFPLTETIVTDDQRGVKRLAKTCIGAYEIACSADTTVLSDPDVIFVGEQFLGVTYTEVGRHDSIFENLKDINGCDSVIMHTLNVQLNPDAKYYYVKTERHGTGDGSNWENAMNGEDFTTYLPLAPDGSTFYVAEGSYKPECDEDYCMFTINSNVTIRGGYPADAKTGDLSDPKKYKTVFDGDKNGDNVITKTTDETGCPVIEVENTDDDAYDMFSSSAERNLNVTFYGISIINAGHGYNAYTESEESALHLNIDNCKFENCRYGAVQSNYLGSLKATESEFIQNGGCLLVPNVTNVEMKDVKMENNYNNYLLQVYDNSSDVNKSVKMESVTATNNTAYMQTSGDVVVSNSTFDKNSCIPYVINEQISSEKSSKIHVRNTKFTDNNCNYNLIYANNSEMTVDTSLFQNNTVTSSMIYPYSLTMDSSRVIGNKCGTGVLFEIIKDVKLTNDIINENEAETAIHIYAPTDDVVLVDQCHVESNKGRLFKHENTANGLNVTMTNSEFIGNTTDEDITWINIIGNGKDVTVLLNKNIIKDNNVSATMITSVSTDFTMDECDVNNNTAKNIMSFASSTVHIFNNALYSNQVTSNVIEANVCWDGVEIENNTIAANKSEKDLLSCYYTSTTYNNNTIVGNDVKDILFRYPYDKSFIGNIIWGNNYTELNYYNFTTTPQYNIMPLYVDRDYTQSDKVGVHIPNETNIVVDYFVDKYKTGEYEIIEEGLDAIKQYASINDIFFGTYDPSTSLFAPEIKNNGGFTPTIALKKDRLTDKTSIRFLLSETTVEQDQRGVARLVSTCMGAYEYIPSDPIECVYESILFKEDFGGNNPSDALYSENGLKEGLCSLPCAGDCPLALNDYMQTGCYALLKEAYRRQPGYRESHIYEGWYADFDDETYLGDIQRGYFMSIDMASKPTTFYQREINDLCENTNLSLSMSARPLYASDNTILYMSVEDMAGNPLTERTEVVIDKTVNEWKEYSVTFSVPQGASSVVFKIYSEGGHQGNDFALDDIIVRLCKAQVDVNRPTEPLCKHTNYTLTANYSGDPSYLEPVNYTWFRNDKETYDLDGWVKVGTGKNYEIKDMTSAVNGYYRCVVSSAGVEGEMSKCNSISDIVPIFVSEYTLEKDTAHILQGETYAGVTYEKVGVFRTSNREVNEFGCDKVVNHVVFVHPGGAEYYVTMDGRSAHTGVDWDNAIDSVEFATYLPLAKAGVVFHVAEGRYRPYFNAYYEKVSKRCYYEINNNVTIIGGYAKDELDETVPNNPKKYRTVFTASSNQENNKMVESTSPRLYSMHIDNEAFVGSFRGLFIANAKAEEVKLDGIVLNYGYGFVGDHSATNLTLNRCSFEEMSDPVHYVKSLHVDTCLFRKVSIGGAPSTLFGGVATEIIIRNTTITDILGGYNDMLTCDYHGINPTLFVLENSTLVNNYAKENLIILPSSGKVRIVNNTIVNNEIGTSLSSLFNVRGNNVSTEITGNLIVGNENVSELSHVCTNTNGSIYKYNLLDLQQELPETNMKMLGRYTSILDGWNAGNRFIPTLRDNGGYTQTVALKSDRLDDGISIIRLPLEKTTVTADQRQYKRISTTCMGAYEIPLTDCEDLLDLPKEHKLTYETQYISFTVPYRCDVRVIVTDLQGRLVRDADMTYRDREGNMTVNLADLRLFELDHDPREPFIMMVKTGSKIHVTYLYITRLDKNY